MTRRKGRQSASHKPVEECNALDLASFRLRFLSQTDLTFQATSLGTFLISLQSAASISEEDLDKCFDLISTTSQSDYEASSAGWHPKAKRKEMKLPDMRYLLVRPTTDSSPVAFISFMITYEDAREVIYVYEIHISGHLCGLGMGKALMNLVEDVGRCAGMEQSMLTVFNANEGAMTFYQRLAYQTDDYSPRPRKLRNGVVKYPDYSILSKRLR